MDDLRVGDEQLHDKGRTGKAYNGDQHAVSGLDAHTAVEALLHTVVLAGTPVSTTV